MINSIKNKIVLGTANFNKNYRTISQKNRISKKDIFQIFEYAKKKNITEIDTATVYKGAEALIGEYISKNKSKVNWKIITKVKHRNKINFYSTINRSIKKLKIIPYAILAHDLKTYKNKYFHEALDSFKSIKRGISVYEKLEATKAINYKKPDIIQFPINLIDQRFEENDFLKYLKKNKIETHARSIFLKGMLYNNNNLIRKENPEIHKLMKEILDHLKKHKISLSDKSLIDIYNNNNIDKLVVGIDNVEQLKKNFHIIKNKNNKYTKIKIKHNLSYKYLDPRKW